MLPPGAYGGDRSTKWTCIWVGQRGNRAEPRIFSDVSIQLAASGILTALRQHETLTMCLMVPRLGCRCQIGQIPGDEAATQGGG